MMKAFPGRKNILVPVCGGWGEGSNANEVDVMENYAAATQSSTYRNIEMKTTMSGTYVNFRIADFFRSKNIQNISNIWEKTTICRQYLCSIGLSNIWIFLDWHQSTGPFTTSCLSPRLISFIHVTIISIIRIIITRIITIFMIIIEAHC